MLFVCVSLCSCHVRRWPFWFGMLLPFAVLYVLNWAVFITILVSLFKNKRNVQPLEKTRYRNTKQNFIILVSLATVFGIGWGLGIAATSSSVIEVTTIFQFLFSILISIHGLLLFIMHGIRNADARATWMKVFVRIRGKFSSGFKKLYSVTPATSTAAQRSTTGETYTASISTLQRRNILGSGLHERSNNNDLELSLVASAVDSHAECKVDLSAGNSVTENVYSECPVAVHDSIDDGCSSVNTERVEGEDEATVHKVDLSVGASVYSCNDDKTPMLGDVGQDNQSDNNSSEIVDLSK